MKYNELQLKAIQAPEDRVVVVATPGSGKALKNGTKILGEYGWINVEDIKVGDKVYGYNGTLTTVRGIYPQGKKQIYNVTFNDRNTIKCCEDHLWAYQTCDMHRGKSTTWRVKSTKELLENVPLFISDSGYNRKNIYLPMVRPIQFTQQKELLIPPYTLGALLGDGCLRKAGNYCMFSNADEDIISRVDNELSSIGSHLKYKDRYDYTITTGIPDKPSLFRKYLRKYNLEGKKSFDKHIPLDYLFASVEQRLELLRGLIDTGGHVADSAYEYYTASKQLSEDVTFLCESLGFLVVVTIKDTSYVNSLGERVKCRDCYRLRIKTSATYPKIHWCSRKDKKWHKAQSYAHRNIVSIEPTQEYAEMTCIEVDDKYHLYVTEHCIVTHNTASAVGAIEYYHQQHPTHKIVAITFTRKAAAELSNKTFTLPVSASTIHSWSLKELNKLGVKYKFKVALLQDEQIQQLLKDLSRKCGYYSLNQFMLFSYVMGNYNIDVSRNAKNKFEKVFKTYTKYKRDNKLYDFTDLPLYLYDMLTLYNERITNIDALFVDEFQDVDEIQARIFEMVDAKKYFYIGDPDQTIYIFRNCDSRNLTNLTNFTTYYLDTNYRSYQKIIDYASTIRNYDCFLSEITKALPSHIKSARTEQDGEVYVITKDEECIDVVKQEKTNLMATLTAFLLQRPFILCRSNKQVKQIESLGYKNVSTIHQAKGLEYVNVIVTDMELTGEEEINIAYVGCTRAQNGLLICNADLLYMYMTEILMEYRDEICGGKLF